MPVHVIELRDEVPLEASVRASFHDLGNEFFSAGPARRTEELMDNFVQLGERGLAAQDQDMVVLYESLVRAGEAIPIDDRVRYRYDSAVVADRCLEMSGRMLKAAGSGG